ncbi:TadE/TadG family type IV pilus assembly protein [Nocardioides marmotae]|uniref:TadE/TadG family type IV pilus assembly protein n=1 Tax=Nocardioides marmotae TaxID=2663857 RepID=UPI0012B5FC71|nr:hypothetical protein [Nocardioides marmotae]MBC9732261.1 hypothetical protein [Nocardioides marmotae]MTB83382.1 hypothetical protein [Nocardioides marmotae]
MARRRDRQADDGAVAVVFAILVVVIFGVAALAVDIGSQINRKHLLINQLDAASTAAAGALASGTRSETGSIAAAVDAAETYFADNGRDTLDLRGVDFWCVVGRKLNPDSTPFSPARAADYQIPTSTQSAGVCNPDARSSTTTWNLSDYQSRPRSWDGRRYSMTCDATLCAIPCGLEAQPSNGWDPGLSLVNRRAIRCNTIRVGAEQDVPFSFAPLLGIDQGSTGNQVSVACAGSCGSVAPNPMDVVVVADRTLSMTEPLMCSTSRSGPCRDYRTDLVDGITSMLQVMTPEQQYVALGALGPSEHTRSSAEARACTANAKGLVYPGANVSTSSGGSWVPISFKKDYLGLPDASGKRSVNTASTLVRAIDCLDDVDSTRENRLASTRTALASPLKAAARYLLNKNGDENNVAALGGGNRSGSVKKVIIFETDGEPYENAATTGPGALSLDNRTDIFSSYTDYTTSRYVEPSPTLGTVRTGTPASVSPAPPAASYPSTYRSGNRTYGYSYRYRTSTTRTIDTRAYTGGQTACENFRRVAELAKQAGILVITIGYNLDGSTMCSGSNDTGRPPAPSTATGRPWISDVQPTTCRQAGDGTQSSPYTVRTSCARDITLTYTVPQSTTVTQVMTGAGDASVTDVLAGASGGTDVPAAQSNGCSTPELTAAENADDDLFFCAARGDDMAPLFITALSKVTTGVKLIRLP